MVLGKLLGCAINYPLINITIWNTNTANPAIVYQLKVGKLTQVMATYGSGDYLPYTHADYRFGYNGIACPDV